MKAVLPIFYLPPVTWFSEFLKPDREVVLEQFENFPKQTYRNRANIYGANGKLSLIIPIHHNGKRAMKDLEISYAENWQKMHWKSIKNAYQSSPYFEYYEAKLACIYESKPKSLSAFNLSALKVILDLLKTEPSYTLTDRYEKTLNEVDFRDSFSAKNGTSFALPEYYQTFGDKFGFIDNLSIIDLLCNIGPESVTYLNKIIK